MPEISVIVPIYNTEKYLAKCVDSILDQSFTDFELILVDDGSEDKSPQICDEFSKKDPRIKVLHKLNGGISEARNFGIDNSTGKYLSFVDSDDWIEKDFLSTLYSLIIENNADISIVNFKKMFEDGNSAFIDINEGVFSKLNILRNIYGDAANYYNIACNKLYNRKLFENIRFPVGKVFEDGYLIYKILYSANKVACSNALLYVYLQREGSIINNTFSLNRMHEYYVYLERRAFFNELADEELTIKNELTRIACMKTITIKLFSSNIEKKEKKIILNIFRNDMKTNFKKVSHCFSFSKKLLNYIFAYFPSSAYLFNKIKGVKR